MLDLKGSGIYFFFAFNIFMCKHGKDAIIDKNSKNIIFGDYQENDLAKWIRRQNRDRSILSRKMLYALKNTGFPFVESLNKRMMSHMLL